MTDKIHCKHAEKETKKGESGYCYELQSGTELWLCKDCNMSLAGEVMKQLAIEVFVK